MNTLMEWIWGMVLFLSFLGLLISLSNELDPTKDTDLLNVRDEMLATINKLAYLLTLE
jgi:hypothetical protein